ncbi:MAG: hypothetical protein HC809_02480 [Gammaproteobacteria bacterium]|nr:hypothetical protein [Gammaproteobacteria bacterium]
MDDEDSDDERARRMRDDVRAQTVARALEDLLWRFNEEHEETLSVYDVIGAVVEGLVGEGMCPACIAESITEAYQRANADPAQHVNEDDGMRVMPNRPDGDVFH